MDEEDAMKDVNRKGEKSEDGSMGTQESQGICAVDATEQVRASGNDNGNAGMKKHLKKNKPKKIKKTKEAEFGFKKGESTAEEDPMDNVERKMKKRREKNITSYTREEVEENGEGGVSKTKSTEERKRKHKDVDSGEIDGNEDGQYIQNCERRKRKMEKNKSKGDSSLLQQENMPEYNAEGNIGLAEHDRNDAKELERKKKKKVKNKYNNDNGLTRHINEMQIGELEYAKKKKKKHTKLIGLLDNGVECDEKGKMRKAKPVKNGADDASPNKSNKKVRFSDNSNIEKENVGGDGLIRGRRFSREEDETVKVAVLHYIEKNDLGDEGVDMVLNCMKYPKVRRCWKEICAALPYRPYSSVYQRAHALFLKSEVRKWTQEEYDLLRSYHKEHGNKWKDIATELGKYSKCVRAAWCRIKGNYNKGHWSQDEYQKLFNLINLDLQAKLSEEKMSMHGMLRDNICWTAISEVLSTRSHVTCFTKWYNQLTSRMVADGEWADKDDYRLIDALYGLDATCVEDVDWDVLLDNRERDVCRKRWDQMVLHIGQNRNKSFSEQVEVLAQRYCPFLLEAREIWDSKPRVG